MWQFQRLVLTFKRIVLAGKIREMSAPDLQNMLQHYIHLELAKEFLSLFIALFEYWDNSVVFPLIWMDSCL